LPADKYTFASSSIKSLFFENEWSRQHREQFECALHDGFSSQSFDFIVISGMSRRASYAQPLALTRDERHAQRCACGSI